MKFSNLRFTNMALLILVLVLSLTGTYGLFWTFNGWVFTLHRVAGWGLIALLPWKVAISFQSLRRGVRPGFDRGVMIGVSLFLSAVTLLVLALGVLWKGRFGPVDYPLRQTAISWHWMLALGLLVPFFLHVWRRWPSLKRVDFASRRAALRVTALAGLTVLGYGLSQRAAQLRELAEAPRRFTGSRQAGTYTGNRFPVTHTVAARPEQIQTDVWRLRVSGSTPLDLDYEALLSLPVTEVHATLDCTLGWFTTQAWQGVTLVDLLERAGVQAEPTGVLIESVTGYAFVLPYEEAKEVLLATHVGGEVLDESHGFPMRVVVPSRRGWFWVKWVTKIEAVPFLPDEQASV